MEDGARGRPETYVSRHREACADHGVKPNLARYRRGHAEGLAQFCTAESGFRYGDSGGTYNGVCPAELREDFLVAYEHGRSLYLLRRDIGQMHGEVDAAEVTLHEIIDRIAGVEKRLASDTGTATQRQAWLQKLKQLQYDRGRLEGEIHALELEAARMQGEYDVLSAQSAY